jgi:hypothetical protein
MNLAPIGWLAFIAATVIFVLLGLGALTNPGNISWWGFALVSFGLAFSGYWGSRNHPTA